MKTLIVYDSFFGNTEQIARAMSSSLGSGESIKALRVTEVKPEHLTGLELVIVGSPTRAFRPTKAITNFLNRIPAHSLRGLKVAAFDTRLSPADVHSRLLNILVKLFGYAAKPMANKLVKKGGELVISPEGFLVKGTKGPLKEGELERAAHWIKTKGSDLDI